MCHHLGYVPFLDNISAIMWGVACFYVEYLFHMAEPGFPQIQLAKKRSSVFLSPALKRDCKL